MALENHDISWFPVSCIYRTMTSAGSLLENLDISWFCVLDNHHTPPGSVCCRLMETDFFLAWIKIFTAMRPHLSKTAAFWTLFHFQSDDPRPPLGIYGKSVYNVFSCLAYFFRSLRLCPPFLLLSDMSRNYLPTGHGISWLLLTLDYLFELSGHIPSWFSNKSTWHQTRYINQHLGQNASLQNAVPVITRQADSIPQLICICQNAEVAYFLRT